MSCCCNLDMVYHPTPNPYPHLYQALTLKPWPLGVIVLRGSWAFKTWSLLANPKVTGDLPLKEVKGGQIYKASLGPSSPLLLLSRCDISSLSLHHLPWTLPEDAPR